MEDKEFRNIVFMAGRPGNDRTMKWNTEVGNRCVELAKREGIELEFEGGGYDEGGKYRSEPYRSPQDELKDPLRPTRNSSYPDVTLLDTETGVRIYINTIDEYVRDGLPKPAEERQAVKMGINRKTDDQFYMVRKPPQDVDLKAYAKRFDSDCRKAVQHLKKLRKLKKEP